MGRKNEKNVAPETFVVAWQKGESLAAVAAALQVSPGNARARATRLRKMGVPLKEYPRQRYNIDVPHLKRIAIDAVNALAHESVRAGPRPTTAARR